RIAHCVEYRHFAFEHFAAASGCDARDDLRTVRHALLGVEAARAAGDALHEDTRVFADEDAHDGVTALTIFSAPSAMLSAGMIARPLDSSIFFPSSTLVPSRRQTTGTFRPSSFAAAMTPSAMTSHFMIPPKIFTKIALTFGLFKMIENAFVTCSLVAPP